MLGTDWRACSGILCTCPRGQSRRRFARCPFAAAQLGPEHAGGSDKQPAPPRDPKLGFLSPFGASGGRHFARVARTTRVLLVSLEVERRHTRQNDARLDSDVGLTVTCRRRLWEHKWREPGSAGHREDDRNRRIHIVNDLDGRKLTVEET